MNYNKYEQIINEYEKYLTDNKPVVVHKVSDIELPGMGYQATYGSLIKPLFDMLYLLGVNPKDLTFLDLGCGQGHLINYMQHVFKKVKGIEHSKKLIKSSLCPELIKHKSVQNVKNTKKYNILYTFNININQKATLFKPILAKLRKDQMFFESYDYGRILAHMVEKMDHLTGIELNGSKLLVLPKKNDFI